MENRKENNLTFEDFDRIRLIELEEKLMLSNSREEKAFWRTLINLKLQLWQEKTVGEILL